ncbi:MAG: hypothetical protein K5654_07925 [Lachnospiraceae bacterium]|nr:hypothetical protein [Lachnospiraceae bacterium]
MRKRNLFKVAFVEIAIIVISFLITIACLKIFKSSVFDRLKALNNDGYSIEESLMLIIPSDGSETTEADLALSSIRVPYIFAIVLATYWIWAAVAGILSALLGTESVFAAIKKGINGADDLFVDDSTTIRTYWSDGTSTDYNPGSLTSGFVQLIMFATLITLGIFFGYLLPFLVLLNVVLGIVFKVVTETKETIKSEAKSKVLKGYQIGVESGFFYVFNVDNKKEGIFLNKYENARLVQVILNKDANFKRLAEVEDYQKYTEDDDDDLHMYYLKKCQRSTRKIFFSIRKLKFYFKYLLGKIKYIPTKKFGKYTISLSDSEIEIVINDIINACLIYDILQNDSDLKIDDYDYLKDVKILFESGKIHSISSLFGEKIKF